MTKTTAAAKVLLALLLFTGVPCWDFLTGSRRDIDAVMKALDAYIPNKMSHYALTLIRTPQGGS